jgi:CheY-like chemotaxis protein
MPVSEPPVVWIVDDDKDDQYLFEVAFKAVTPPVGVKLLDDGEQFLLALSQTETLPSLIVLDVNMPRLSGFDTLKRLRAEPAYKNLPVVILTTSSRPEDQDKAILLGANGFLTKLGSTGNLLMLLNQLVPSWQRR